MEVVLIPHFYFAFCIYLSFFSSLKYSLPRYLIFTVTRLVNPSSLISVYSILCDAFSARSILLFEKLYCSNLSPQCVSEADFLFFSLRQTLCSASPRGISSAYLIYSGVRNSPNLQKKQRLLHPDLQGMVSFSHNEQVSISDTTRYPSGVYFFSFKTKCLLYANNPSFYLENRTYFPPLEYNKKTPRCGEFVVECI